MVTGKYISVISSISGTGAGGIAANSPTKHTLRTFSGENYAPSIFFRAYA